MAVLEGFRQLGKRWRDSAHASMLGMNFRSYGPKMGFPDYDAFVQRANLFYDESMSAKEKGDIRYRFVSLEKGKTGVDFDDGELRGIFTKDGTPLSFFSPKLRENLNTMQRQQEVEDFLQISYDTSFRHGKK